MQRYDGNAVARALGEHPDTEVLYLGHRPLYFGGENTETRRCRSLDTHAYVLNLVGGSGWLSRLSLVQHRRFRWPIDCLLCVATRARAFFPMYVIQDPRFIGRGTWDDTPWNRAAVTSEPLLPHDTYQAQHERLASGSTLALNGLRECQFQLLRASTILWRLAWLYAKPRANAGLAALA